MKNKTHLKKEVPYKQQKTEKTEQIAGMFNGIARNYDFLNHFMSFGIHKIWRKKALKKLKKQNPETILDIATGTADFAIKAAQKTGVLKITGIDISSEMLKIGQRKIRKKNLTHIINLQQGNCENLMFKNNSFDAITVSFGVRNFQHLTQSISEMYRVLKNNSNLIILELSEPENKFIKAFYNFYVFRFLPFLGYFFAKDREAYIYLPKSIAFFSKNIELETILKQIGFKNITVKKLTFGVASIYHAQKIDA